MSLSWIGAGRAPPRLRQKPWRMIAAVPTCATLPSSICRSSVPCERSTADQPKAIGRAADRLCPAAWRSVRTCDMDFIAAAASRPCLSLGSSCMGSSSSCSSAIVLCGCYKWVIWSKEPRNYRYATGRSSHVAKSGNVPTCQRDLGLQALHGHLERQLRQLLGLFRSFRRPPAAAAALAHFAAFARLPPSTLGGCILAPRDLASRGCILTPSLPPRTLAHRTASASGPTRSPRTSRPPPHPLAVAPSVAAAAAEPLLEPRHEVRALSRPRVELPGRPVPAVQHGVQGEVEAQQLSLLRRAKHVSRLTRRRSVVSRQGPTASVCCHRVATGCLARLPPGWHNLCNIFRARARSREPYLPRRHQTRAEIIQQRHGGHGDRRAEPKRKGAGAVAQIQREGVRRQASGGPPTVLPQPQALPTQFRS
jgi:hypothetical protein